MRAYWSLYPLLSSGSWSSRWTRRTRISWFTRYPTVSLLSLRPYWSRLSRAPVHSRVTISSRQPSLSLRPRTPPQSRSSLLPCLSCFSFGTLWSLRPNRTYRTSLSSCPFRTSWTLDAIFSVPSLWSHRSLFSLLPLGSPCPPLSNFTRVSSQPWVTSLSLQARLSCFTHISSPTRKAWGSRPAS